MNKLLLAVLLVGLSGFLTVKAGDEEIIAEKHLELMKALLAKSPDNYQEYRSLIALSENHSEKCGHDEIYEFRRRSKADQDVPDDIKIYKNYQWKKRVEACHETWTKNIENDVKTLNLDDEKAVKSIVEEIKKNMKEDSFSTDYRGFYVGLRYAFPNGLYDYLKKNKIHEPKELMNGKKGNKLLAEDLERLVINPCNHVLQQLDGSMSIYNTFIHFTTSDEDISDKDEYTKSWLETYGMCKVIVNSGGYISDLERMFKNEYPQYTKSGKVLKCLGLDCNLRKEE